MFVATKLDNLSEKSGCSAVRFVVTKLNNINKKSGLLADMFVVAKPDIFNEKSGLFVDVCGNETVYSEEVFCSHVYGNKTQPTKIFVAQQPVSWCHLFMRFVDNQGNIEQRRSRP